ncbi:hypothetical protein NO135_24470, partial [Clostridioides difficile]|nr:hypothetical protein [Clostridioides difficile]
MVVGCMDAGVRGTFQYPVVTVPVDSAAPAAEFCASTPFAAGAACDQFTAPPLGDIIASAPASAAASAA